MASPAGGDVVAKSGEPPPVAIGAPEDTSFHIRSNVTQSHFLLAPVCRRTPGHFFGYFLWGLAKKVSRLPAGTGELEVKMIMFCWYSR